MSAQPQAAMESNKKALVRWFDEVWNQGRRETIDEMFGAECVLHDGVATYTGPEEFSVFYDKVRSKFSDIHVSTQRSVSEGDLVSMQWSVDSTHIATGKKTQVTGMSMVQFENGQMREAWQNWDIAGVEEQISGKSPSSFI